jgi:hypothetical protein
LPKVFFLPQSLQNFPNPPLWNFRSVNIILTKIPYLKISYVPYLPVRCEFLDQQNICWHVLVFLWMRVYKSKIFPHAPEFSNK